MAELRVKEILKSRGLTQKDLAIKMNIAEISLSRSLRGKPTFETLEKIATALDVQVWELVTASTTGEINGFVEYRGAIYKIQSREDLQQLNDLVNK